MGTERLCESLGQLQLSENNRPRSVEKGEDAKGSRTVTVTLKDGSIKVPKELLREKSDYFKALFSFNAEANKDHVNLHEVDTAHFDWLIKFHQGEDDLSTQFRDVDPQSFHRAVDLLKTSVYLQFSSAEEALSDELVHWFSNKKKSSSWLHTHVTVLSFLLRLLKTSDDVGSVILGARASDAIAGIVSTVGNDCSGVDFVKLLLGSEMESLEVFVRQRLANPYHAMQFLLAVCEIKDEAIETFRALIEESRLLEAVDVDAACANTSKLYHVTQDLRSELHSLRGKLKEDVGCLNDEMHHVPTVSSSQYVEENRSPL